MGPFNVFCSQSVVVPTPERLSHELASPKSKAQVFPSTQVPFPAPWACLHVGSFLCSSRSDAPLVSIGLIPFPSTRSLSRIYRLFVTRQSLRQSIGRGTGKVHLALHTSIKMLMERPLSFKRASARQTLYPYPDSPALGEQDRRSMSTTGGALPRRETYRSGVFSLLPQKTGEQLARTTRYDDGSGSGDERDPAEIEAAYLNLVGGGGSRSRNISSELSFGMSGDKDTDGLAYSIEDSKRRTNFYEEQFQYKGNSLGSVRERIEKDSPVVAELRTNVIVCC